MLRVVDGHSRAEIPIALQTETIALRPPKSLENKLECWTMTLDSKNARVMFPCERIDRGS